jgi:ABC-type Zn2+ transport system substrate-binding protein/surface adhesin
LVSNLVEGPVKDLDDKLHIVFVDAHGWFDSQYIADPLSLKVKVGNKVTGKAAG